MLLINTLVVLATVVAMEGLAWFVHRYIMHGPIGWGWHKSHHEHTEGWFEVNDLYAVVFTVLAGAIMTFGIAGVWPLHQIGMGLMVYGILYFIVHDGLVHQRWPFNYAPKNSYLRRLIRGHQLHHAVHGRDGAVSFGFLYSPKVEHLKAKLRDNRSAMRRRRRPTREGAVPAKTEVDPGLVR